MRLALVVALTGCGRVGFEAVANDASRDAPTGCGGLFCDDFEATQFNPRWQLDTFSGDVSLDTSRAHGGSRSAHVRTNAISTSTTNLRATLLTYDSLPVTATIYVRAWVYFTSPQPGGLFDQMINLADDPGNGMSMGDRGGLLANNDYTAGNYLMSATALPLDRWACVIFAMPSGTTTTSRIFLDGAEVTDLPLPKTSAQPPPTHLYLGIEWVGTLANQAQADAWFDDVVVATAMPGC